MNRRPRYPAHWWWRSRSLPIPPESPSEWLRLAAVEIWLGTAIVLLIGFGVWLITTSPDRIIGVLDLSGCYSVPPAPPPCERMIYRGGALNVGFSALAGFVMIAVSGGILWSLWHLAEPRPIHDDFLRLLNDSFGRDWRNPLTWPWAQLLWAYGFTTVGAALTAGLAVMIWSVVTPDPKPLTPSVGTSQSFRTGQ